MDSLDEEFRAINKILDEVDERLQVVSKGTEELEIETKLLSIEIEDYFNKWGGHVWDNDTNFWNWLGLPGLVRNPICLVGSL